MENARLLTNGETREALEQQTATTDVLRSSIRRPAISTRCSTQCLKRRFGFAKPHKAILRTFDGEVFRLAAMLRRVRASPEFNRQQRGPFPPDPWQSSAWSAGE